MLNEIMSIQSKYRPVGHRAIPMHDLIMAKMFYTTILGCRIGRQLAADLANKPSARQHKQKRFISVDKKKSIPFWRHS